MLGIGAVSAKTGIKLPTIRYYEQVGLLAEPNRSEGNHRIYTKAHIGRLKFIKRSRELGFSLDEIRHLLGLNDDLPPTCEQIHQLTKEHLENVRSKISDLQKIELILRELSVKCENNETVECPVIESIYGY